MNIPPGWNHPDSTPIKPEEPEDFFSDKPVPLYRWGMKLRHTLTGRRGEVIGLLWRRNSHWFYCLDYSGEGYGQWFKEKNLEEVNND